MRSIVATILGVFLVMGSAFAACSLTKSGDHASTLIEASKALEASNPELAAKVKAIADDCCKLGLHAGNSEAASKSEHPTTASSEHPTAASSEHPSGGHSEHPSSAKSEHPTS